MVQNIFAKAKAFFNKRTVPLVCAALMMSGCASWKPPAVPVSLGSPAKLCSVAKDDVAFMRRAKEELLKIANGKTIVVLSHQDVWAADKIMSQNVPADAPSWSPSYLWAAAAKAGAESLAKEGMVLSGEQSERSIARALYASPKSLEMIFVAAYQFPYATICVNDDLSVILAATGNGTAQDTNRLEDYILNGNKKINHSSSDDLFSKSDVDKFWSWKIQRGMVFAVFAHEFEHACDPVFIAGMKKVNAPYVYRMGQQRLKLLFQAVGLFKGMRALSKALEEPHRDVLQGEIKADVRAARAGIAVDNDIHALQAIKHVRAVTAVLKGNGYTHATQFELGKYIKTIDGQDYPYVAPKNVGAAIEKTCAIFNNSPWAPGMKKDGNVRHVVLGAFYRAYKAGVFDKSPKDVQAVAKSVVLAVEYFIEKAPDLKRSFFSSEQKQVAKNAQTSTLG